MDELLDKVKKGTYSLILVAEHLKSFAITKEKIEEEKKSAKLYSFLNERRIQCFEDKARLRKTTIEATQARHNLSIEYQKWLFSRRPAEEEKFIQFLEQLNPGGILKGKRSRTICLSDATGSMGSVWQSAKIYIGEMVRRITTVGGVGAAELKWIAYRDYCDGKRITEASKWTDNGEELLRFIETISCDGGGDYPEAVEIGLQEANAEEDVTQVILIADAPPHMEGKGKVIAFHKKTLETDYVTEAMKFKEKGVKIHCFYMNEEAELKKSFNHIATLTGGKFSSLKNASQLVDIVCENVVVDIDPSLLEVYRKTFSS